MMWNTGIGTGMWLVMAIGTVAFWMLIVWMVRELFTPHEHPRRTVRHAGGHGGGQTGTGHGLEDTDPLCGRDRPEGAGDCRDLRAVGGGSCLERQAGLSGLGQLNALNIIEQRLARGEIDVDEYARIRRTLIESNPSLGRDQHATGP